MHVRDRVHRSVLAALLGLLALSGLLVGCTSEEPTSESQQDTSTEETQQAEADSADDSTTDAAGTYSWAEIEVTDVVTGETFMISDFAGSQVLMQVFAVW